MRIGRIRIKFEPRDLWIGVYWTRYFNDFSPVFAFVYICIVPTFPVVIPLINKKAPND
jgi:hypothetical protein